MTDNYLRLIAAELYSLLFLHTSAMIHRKPWFDLSDEEKSAVRANVAELVSEHAGWLTPEVLDRYFSSLNPDQKQSNRPLGFAPKPS